MRHRTLALVGAIIIAALVSSTGCVSKGMFRQRVEDSDARVGAVESAVEANERRIETLKDRTDAKLAGVEERAARAEQVGSSALGLAEQAAEAAERAEKGKLIWYVTLSDERVKFSFGQARIPDAAAAVLDDLVSEIRAYGKQVFIEIEGHTDDRGDAGYNLMLGQKRAEAVRVYLNEKGGIPLHVMNTISYGESRPIGDNSTREGRGQNRRVVIRVLE